MAVFVWVDGQIALKRKETASAAVLRHHFTGHIEPGFDERGYGFLNRSVFDIVMLMHNAVHDNVSILLAREVEDFDLHNKQKRTNYCLG